MPMTLRCEGCGKTLRVRDELAGKKGKCSACGTVLIVPSPEPPLQAQSPATEGEAVAGVTGQRLDAVFGCLGILVALGGLFLSLALYGGFGASPVLLIGVAVIVCGLVLFMGRTLTAAGRRAQREEKDKLAAEAAEKVSALPAYKEHLDSFQGYTGRLAYSRWRIVGNMVKLAAGGALLTAIMAFLVVKAPPDSRYGLWGLYCILVTGVITVGVICRGLWRASTGVPSFDPEFTLGQLTGALAEEEYHLALACLTPLARAECGDSPSGLESKWRDAARLSELDVKRVGLGEAAFVRGETVCHATFSWRRLTREDTVEVTWPMVKYEKRWYVAKISLPTPGTPGGGSDEC